MIWDEFLRHFRFCDEEDSGLSDEEQERKGPKNRPKHTRKRIHQAKKNFLEKFKTASEWEITCLKQPYFYVLRLKTVRFPMQKHMVSVPKPYVLGTETIKKYRLHRYTT
ncbi:hypothetical protein QUW14_05850 [Bacteroides gallinaceum]|uniref:hypothetical protein n=1 Tax=Bacteroides gallinaceum TaxID=1462571 RepID=UPI0025A3FC52|nr:hypothetical protein [Bacteroides gallinaceum]MDM8153844.1 hypothetical protein [Bacteroides gallinaceum]